MARRDFVEGDGFYARAREAEEKRRAVGSRRKEAAAAPVEPKAEPKPKVVVSEWGDIRFTWDRFGESVSATSRSMEEMTWAWTRAAEDARRLREEKERRRIAELVESHVATRWGGVGGEWRCEQCGAESDDLELFAMLGCAAERGVPAVSGSAKSEDVRRAEKWKEFARIYGGLVE